MKVGMLPTLGADVRWAKAADHPTSETRVLLATDH